jgi:hypothetical protein
MKAKVWNDNKWVYTEKFNGDQITIPAGGYIEMEYMEAVQFKGTMNSIIRDADGAPKAESFKMIRVEPMGDLNKEAKSQVSELVCQACTYKAVDQVDLAKHILENHAESFADKSRDEAGKKLQEALRKGK